MPGWHKRTASFVADGRLNVVGVLQEQHPNRARLFHQWKGMDFPLLVDGLNRLGVKVVPIRLLLDGKGRIVKVNPRGREFEGLLDAIEAKASDAVASPPLLKAPNLKALAGQAKRSLPDAIALADGEYLWGSVSTAIEVYRRVLKQEPGNSVASFRLGVALRRRFETTSAMDDFRQAIAAWRAARFVDPNQYIWRRRIQQYGPRLDKPYPFYDWVAVARKAIRSSGQEPVTLLAEPIGAEIAQPTRGFVADTDNSAEPDPNGKISRDKGAFISVRQATVPDTKGRPAIRVHMDLTPRTQRKAHWNNESDPVTLWLNAPEGWSADATRHLIPQDASRATSDETRHVEFEVHWPQGTPAGKYTVQGYLLYNVCEGTGGTCLFRRQDVAVEVVVK